MFARNWKVFASAVLVALLPAVSFGFTVDMKKSDLTWKAEKEVGSGHVGKLPLKSAKVEEKGGQIKSGEFVVDMKNFTVTDLSGKWKEKFLGHVRSGDFFEVEKFPEAKLMIKEVKGEKAKGTLTIKKKEQPIEITFKKDKSGSYTGKMTFDRTKFGITYGSKNFFKLAADKIIKNMVTVEFKIVPSKAKPKA